MSPADSSAPSSPTPAPADAPALATIAGLLAERFGLDSGTLGPGALAGAVRQRIAATGSPDAASYVGRLADPEETQQLVDALVVPETWFNRDPRAFDAMTGHVLSRTRLPDASGRRPQRLLSLPCSSGEEAYSIAMALLDAGLGTGDFIVEAVDVSSRNIAAAERAVYGRNSFRGAELGFRDRYFEPVAGGFRPVEAVRAPVRLRVGNLFDPLLFAGEPGFDVIFCRNLLIYFDRQQQARALRRLDGLLAPDGLLLVGPAESGLPLLHGFTSLRTPMAFAFTRAPVAPASPRRVASPRPASLAGASTARAPLRPKAPPLATAPGAAPLPRTSPPATPPARPGRPPVADADPTVTNQNVTSPAATSPAAISLASIEAAANAGRLAEAAEAASVHLERFGPSAAAFYLLGLARDAAGEAEGAVEAYRKALYLAPTHREALAHLGLLLRRQGDTAGAQRLAERLRRLDAGDGTRGEA